MIGGKEKTTIKPPRDRFLPKFTTFFFNRPLLTALLWLLLVAFGSLSYVTLLKREGFPSVNIPFSIITGTYFVNDPAKVDNDVAKPLSEAALQESSAQTIQSSSADNFFTLQIQYEESTDAAAAARNIEKRVNESGQLPKNAVVQYYVPYFGATFGDIQQIDVALSFFSQDPARPLSQTVSKAEETAKWLSDKKLPLVKSVFVKSPYESATDPQTGQAVSVQRSFDRFGNRHDDKTEFHNSVIIGIAKVDGADVIKLDNQVRSALAELHSQPQFQGYRAEVSASFAPGIKDNLSELQRVLLEGLIAVLVVGSIVIAIRASAITVVSMVTVLILTLGFLYAIGYTLNVITLFALILSLSLIVDDTIIMVEAIDAARRHQKDRRKVVFEATRKISRAMVAATVTACLSFAPLIFVGGILGSFIRAIPITIISALIISLIVALVFIPFFSRFVLLGKRQMAAKALKEVGASFEGRLAAFMARPMLWARRSKRRLFSVGITALIIGFGFLFAGLGVARNVIFNIFPPTKDTNGIVLTINFPPGTDVEKAQSTAAKVDELAAEVIGPNFVHSSYYGSGSAQTSTELVEIISYNDRDIRSPEIVKQLQERFDKQFQDARVAVAQSDIGPPSAPFIIQLEATNREAAFKAAEDVAAYLERAELKRPSGKIARFVNINVSTPNQYLRAKAKPIVTVSTGFDGNDTTTLVTLAEDAVKKEFPDDRLKQYGLTENSLSFELGQESENQDSFRTLVLAFPVLLGVMYILLAFQFRSLLQPLLIFMAIPFSIFGVMLGLYLTDNAISFFTMLGWFALVGLSIKNTILLTDYANQARRSGLSAIDAAVAALEERFRPLFATSMTAVVALIPLALTSPFWQGLAVVLIFGLLSNTFLVITVFPYYYLGAEYLRLHISAKHFFVWLLLTGLAAVGVGAITNVGLGLLIIPASIALASLQNFYKNLLLNRRSTGV